MGMGYAFAAFLVLIVVLPIAGLIWFALDEIFTGGGRNDPSRPTRPRSS